MNRIEKFILNSSLLDISEVAKQLYLLKLTLLILPQLIDTLGNLKILKFPEFGIFTNGGKPLGKSLDNLVNLEELEFNIDFTNGNDADALMKTKAAILKKLKKFIFNDFSPESL